MPASDKVAHTQQPAVMPRTPESAAVREELIAVRVTKKKSGPGSIRARR